jgi:hypothetical protein
MQEVVWRSTRWRKEVHLATASLIFVADDTPEKLTTKAQKITIKLPWEISTIYGEVLKDSGQQSDDEENEDDIEAYMASVERLKEADDATREMTREEYQHYSDCRQASFTYRKGASLKSLIYTLVNFPRLVQGNGFAISLTYRLIWISNLQTIPSILSAFWRSRWFAP